MKLNSTIIQHGFQKAGIFPFSSTVVSKENFNPIAYQRWCEELLNESDEYEAEEELNEITQENNFMKIIDSDVSALELDNCKVLPKEKNLMYLCCTNNRNYFIGQMSMTRAS